MENYSFEYLNKFYIHQTNQISQINKISDWFTSMYSISNTTNKFIDSKNTNNTILILGNIGIGKSEIVNTFLKNCDFDVIHISRLFDVYEANKTYTTKDFIPKILKQKNISNYDNINKIKLLVIDSLEEFFELHKAVLRELIDNLENLNMPIVIVGDKNSYNDLEKKLLTKLRKCTNIIDLETPSKVTITHYIKNMTKYNFKKQEIDKLVHYSNGDLRYLNNMLYFQNLLKETAQKSLVKNIGENFKDVEIEVESTIKNIGSNKISDSFYKCETDPFIFGMLTYENYIYNTNKFPEYKRNFVIEQLCLADQIEKNLFKFQQWELLDIYSFFSTIYPWRILEKPTIIHPSTTLQKFLNTKKRNKKYNLPF